MKWEKATVRRADNDLKLGSLSQPIVVERETKEENKYKKFKNQILQRFVVIRETKDFLSTRKRRMLAYSFHFL